MIYMAKSPLNWVGGKSYIAKDIIQLFPQHQTYVEGFGGAAWVLFTKEPSPIEVYNDIDSNLYNFFNVLRDNEKAQRLIELLDLTLYSREEYYNCLKNLKTGKIKEFNDVEQARQFFVCCIQGFSGTIGGGWSYSIKHNREPKGWLNKVNGLVEAIERFKSVQVEHLDINDLLLKYDTEDTLFYLDPPYVSDTRTKNIYCYEMSNDKHREMCEILLNVKGKVILSGYDNEIYKEILEANGWRKIVLKECTLRSQKKSRKDKKTEYVWVNYDVT